MKGNKVDFHTREKRRFGYNSRAAFKLADMHKKYNIIKGNCLELGSYPGGWTGIASSLCEKLVCVDLKETPKVGNEIFLKGSINNSDFIDSVIAEYGPFDTIISDIAPNISGIRERDEESFVEIMIAIEHIIKSSLKKKGNCAIKFFNYAYVVEHVKTISQMFKSYRNVRPKATKSSSSEVYMIGLGLKDCYIKT